MPAYWSLLSVTGPQFYRADSNTPRSVYFKIRQIAAVLEWRLHAETIVKSPAFTVKLAKRNMAVISEAPVMRAFTEEAATQSMVFASQDYTEMKLAKIENREAVYKRR